MATIKRFEDLIVWQKARELTKYIYSLTRSSKFKNDRGLTDQIQRASVSVMSNIAEGFERGTNQGFLNYLFIARGSAGEVRAQLYIAYDLSYISEEEFNKSIQMVQEVSSLIYKFVQSVKSSTFKGLQHKRTAQKPDNFLDELNEEARRQGLL